MNSFSVISLNCSVEIRSNTIDTNKLKVDIINNKLLYRFIPNFALINGKGKIFLSVEDEPHSEASISLNNSYIKGLYNKDFTSTDIIVMVEYLLERLRQNQGVCIIHSSSIVDSKGGIVIFGNPTGTGKTSLALFMNSKMKYKIYSDEKTLVNLKSINLCGQTSKIYLEEKTIKSLDKVGLKPQSIISLHQHKNSLLKLLINPVVLSNVDETICIKYKEDQLKWLLYEEFSKDIRLLNGLIMDFSYPLFPPLDTFKLAQKREKYISNIINTVPCYRIIGKLENIAKKVDQIYKEL